MTKKKNRPFDRYAQPTAEDREELEQIPVEFIHALDEELAQELALWDSCAERAAEALVDLVRVPSAGREQFREEISDLVCETIQDYCVRGAKLSKAYADLERSIPAAWVATNKLTKGERDYLEHAMEESALYLQGWRHTLSIMVRACTRLTGKNPYSGGARGRRKGDIKDYPLKSFVTGLAVTFMGTGGHLTLDVKGQRGTWVEALNTLRPLLPNGFIPTAPPLSTIERWIREAEKTPL